MLAEQQKRSEYERDRADGKPEGSARFVIRARAHGAHIADSKAHEQQ